MAIEDAQVPIAMRAALVHQNEWHPKLGAGSFATPPALPEISLGISAAATCVGAIANCTLEATRRCTEALLVIF